MQELTNFLIKSTKEGYASGEGRIKVEEKDGSTSIYTEDGYWKSHDNYFGGEPYGGRIIVFYQEKPVWMMVYYGLVSNEVKDIDSVYGILMKALSQIPEEAPYRGPAEFVEGSMRYENSWNGDVANYAGEERILSNGVQVYSAWYRGGLVDIR